jgi:glycine/D-amino acid oxidase-like deaminating enzyme
MAYLGQEAMEVALRWLQELEKRARVILHRGIFRAALTQDQQYDFEISCRRFPRWVEKVVWRGFAGMWIPQGCVLSAVCFVDTLWALCEEKGATWIQKKVESLDQLPNNEFIVLATGAWSHLWDPSLHSFYNKGQSFQIHIKGDIDWAVSAGGQIGRTDRDHILMIGSTYEHGDLSCNVNLDKAKPFVEQMESFYPEVTPSRIVQGFVGLRVGDSKRPWPLIRTIASNTSLFTGLGSRGLLYAPYFAEQLAIQIEKP